MMDFAVAIFLAVLATVVASVVLGKELDESEKEYVGNKRNNEEYGYGENEIENQKEEAQAVGKSQGKWNNE